MDNQPTVDQKATINALRGEIDALLPSGARVLLFGSRARGTCRPDSDWDLLVILNRDGHSTWEDYDNVGYPLNMLFWSLGQDVNTIIQTKDEWNQKSFTPFYKNVMKDAIVLI
ncbi:MAG: nucleotidyltransferase domain-containing protein [Bacteroidales bacterium]|nr:nucleotidyltransferase domain-containing protein [Bacteroidales bacterium]